MGLCGASDKLVIAHRGASADFPENTMLAFREALQQGADALEFDLQVSADGVPVVIHDATLERTTDGRGLVRNLEASELGALNAGMGEGIPLLANVLDEFAGTPMVIELKDPRGAPAAASLVRDRGSAEEVLFGSFDRSALKALPAGVRRSASAVETGFFWLGTRLGVARVPESFAAFTVPEYRGMVHVVDGRFLAATARVGLPVHVWTVDDAADARRLWSAGVTGIITNRPGLMAELRDNLKPIRERTR